MANPGGKQWGLTAPLSTALPTAAEIDASAALVLELKRQNNYESDLETKRRYLSNQSTFNNLWCYYLTYILILDVSLTFPCFQGRRPPVTSINHRRIRPDSLQSTGSRRGHCQHCRWQD